MGHSFLPLLLLGVELNSGLSTVQLHKMSHTVPYDLSHWVWVQVPVVLLLWTQIYLPAFRPQIVNMDLLKCSQGMQCIWRPRRNQQLSSFSPWWWSSNVNLLGSTNLENKVRTFSGPFRGSLVVQYRVIVETVDSGAKLCQLEFKHCYLEAMWHWTSQVTFCAFSLCICKMEIMRVQSQSHLKILIYIKHLEQHLLCSKPFTVPACVHLLWKPHLVWVTSSHFSRCWLPLTLSPYLNLGCYITLPVLGSKIGS